jgi:microcystin-dependent protein
MAFFNYPQSIDRNTPAVANEVQTNFDALLAWVMDNLIQKDGTVAMTGPLVLAPGDPASPSQAANKAYVDKSRLVGEIVMYGGASLPTGWLWCDGQTYSNTSQPLLAAAISRNFTLPAVPAGSFSVPDMRKRMPAGADASEAAVFGLGVKGGQRDTEIRAHSHVIPAHGHGASGTSNQVDLQHQHPVNIVTNVAGQHGHNLGHGANLYYVEGNQGEGATSVGSLGRAQWLHDGNHQHSVDGFTGVNHFDGGRYHSHTIGVTVNNQPAFNTENTGPGTTLVDKNLPPYVAVNYIIYAGA